LKKSVSFNIDEPGEKEDAAPPDEKPDSAEEPGFDGNDCDERYHSEIGERPWYWALATTVVLTGLTISHYTIKHIF
jgi:hypothetical protein